MYKINSINKRYGRITFIYVKGKEAIIDIFKNNFTKKNIESIQRQSFENVLIIFSILVPEFYRRRGFGRMLLYEVINKDKTAKCVLIADKRESKTLPEFYKKVGFKKLFTSKAGQFMIRG